MNIIEELDLKIKELEDQKKQIQDSCPHTALRKIARSNTGNYDPTADYYWYDCFCPLCLKSWSEEQ